jgi:hypothetical protein
MKNKLLKSSAFVLALSSSLSNQSEAMDLAGPYETLKAEVHASIVAVQDLCVSTLRARAALALKNGREMNCTVLIPQFWATDSLEVRWGKSRYYTFTVNPNDIQTRRPAGDDQQEWDAYNTTEEAAMLGAREALAIRLIEEETAALSALWTEWVARQG